MTKGKNMGKAQVEEEEEEEEDEDRGEASQSREEMSISSMMSEIKRMHEVQVEENKRIHDLTMGRFDRVEGRQQALEDQMSYIYDYMEY